MRNGICDKCGSESIYATKRGLMYGDSNLLSVNNGGVIRDTVGVDTYVCSRCGYFENYVEVEDLPVLAKITQNANWVHISKRQ